MAWWEIRESSGRQTRCRDCERRLSQAFITKNPRPTAPDNTYTNSEARERYYKQQREWSKRHRESLKPAGIPKGKPMFRGHGNRGGFSLCHKCAVKMAEEIYNQFGELIIPKHEPVDLMARFDHED